MTLSVTASFKGSDSIKAFSFATNKHTTWLNDDSGGEEVKVDKF